MAEPTLVEIFGAGATQTATTITIQKASLTGLTPSATNSAESLFAGIVKQAATTLTDANFAANSDQSITLVPSFESIIQRTVGGVLTGYLQSQFNIGFNKLQSTTGITPDSY